MDKDDERHIDRVWEVIKKAGICMMVTRFGGGLRARPLEARPDHAAEVIWFLTDVRGLKSFHHRQSLRLIKRRRPLAVSIRLLDTFWNRSRLPWRLDNWMTLYWGA
jgi:hypothetical protein